MTVSRLKRWFVKRALVKSLICRVLPNGLYVFNYHRIGNIENNLFDDNVFSCTATEFDYQLAEITKHFRVIDPANIGQYFGRPLDHRAALITFDDGYKDNYEIAFPLLKKHSVKAFFFVPTGYVGETLIPWWDQIAYAVKMTSEEGTFWNGCESVTVTQKNRNDIIVETIKKVKSQNDLLNSEAVRQIISQNNVDLSFVKDKGLFMNWQELAELKEAGMMIGSHSVKHNILVSLSAEKQKQELSVSKQTLDSQLRQDTTAFAYPVGNETHFNTDIKKLLSESGYHFAFSNMPACNDCITDTFSINRFSINKETVFDVLFDNFLR